MGPSPPAGEFLEEEPGHDRRGARAGRDVLEIGHFGIELLAVVRK